VVWTGVASLYFLYRWHGNRKGVIEALTP
jgi:hypothetical protein